MTLGTSSKSQKCNLEGMSGLRVGNNTAWALDASLSLQTSRDGDSEETLSSSPPHPVCSMMCWKGTDAEESHGDMAPAWGVS